MTEICIQNLLETKKGATLLIYDDHSTEYDLNWLRELAPSAFVLQKPIKLGIERLRFEIHRDISLTPFQYIYHTDNDTIHDPEWLTELHRIFMIYPKWIGLYRSPFHKYKLKADRFFFGTTCPGVSYFYPLNALDTEKLKTTKHKFWDFAFGEHLKEVAVSEVSYVEHFGGGGLHNSDFERDRAINPTPYLVSKREEVLNLLGVVK